jgi:hypothetical protein
VEEGTTNLLSNPSFETYTGTSGVADNWLSALNSTVTPNYSVESIGYNSNRSQKIEITNSTGLGDAIVYQWHTLTIGSTYTLSAYVRGNVTGTCVGFVRIAPKPVGGTTINTFVPTNQWQRVSVTATIPEKTSFCEITVGLRAMTAGDIGTLYIDNVQLEEKPFATSFTEGTRANGNLKLNIPIMPNFVVHEWVKHPQLTAVAFAFTWGTNSANKLAIRRLTSGAFDIEHRKNSVSQFSSITATYPWNEWLHVVFIKNGLEVKLYINGELATAMILNEDVGEYDTIYFKNAEAFNWNNGLIANLLIARYDPAIWTDEYIRFLYETQKPFYV